MSNGMFLGMVSGLGQAYQRHNESLLTQEVERRKQLAGFWESMAKLPEGTVAPEFTEQAVRNYLEIVKTPLEKKLSKNVEGIQPIPTQVGSAGWQLGQGKNEMQVQKSPLPTELEEREKGQIYTTAAGDRYLVGGPTAAAPTPPPESAYPGLGGQLPERPLQTTPRFGLPEMTTPRPRVGDFLGQGQPLSPEELGYLGQAPGYAPQPNPMPAAATAAVTPGPRPTVASLTPTLVVGPGQAPTRVETPTRAATPTPGGPVALGGAGRFSAGKTERPRTALPAETLSAPTPPPPEGFTRSPFLTQAEREATTDRLARRKLEMELEGEGRKAEMLAKIAQQYPPPDQSLTDVELFLKDPKQYEEYARLKALYDPQAPKSMGRVPNGVIVPGNPTPQPAVFDPTPATTGYYNPDNGQKYPPGTREYRPPPTPLIQERMQTGIIDRIQALPVQWQSPAMLAMQGLAPERQFAVVAQLQAALQRNDDWTAAGMLRQNVLAQEDATQANRLRSTTTAIRSLETLNGLLKEMERQGVDTGPLEAGAQAVLTRVGTSRHPLATQFQTRLAAAFSAYRLGMSGLAFTAKEDSDYRTQWPDYLNQPPVNYDKIEALIAELSLRDASFWDDRLGPGFTDMDQHKRQIPQGPPRGAGDGGAAGGERTVTYPDGTTATFRVNPDGTLTRIR